MVVTILFRQGIIVPSRGQKRRKKGWGRLRSRHEFTAGCLIQRMSSKDATRPFAPGLGPNAPGNGQPLPSGSDLILHGSAATEHLGLPLQDGGIVSQLAKNPFFTAVGVNFCDWPNSADLLVDIVGLRSGRSWGSSYSRPKRCPAWCRPPPQADVG